MNNYDLSNRMILFEMSSTSFFINLIVCTGSYDFIGVNHYYSEYVTSESGTDSGSTANSTTVSF